MLLIFVLVILREWAKVATAGVLGDGFRGQDAMVVVVELIVFSGCFS